MSAKHRLRTLVCCAVLELGALVGIPMRPEQIRELMHTLNQPKIAHTNPDDVILPGGTGPDPPG